MTRKKPTVVTRANKAQLLKVSMISSVSGIQYHMGASFTFIDCVY